MKTFLLKNSCVCLLMVGLNAPSYGALCPDLMESSTEYNHKTKRDKKVPKGVDPDFLEQVDAVTQNESKPLKTNGFEFKGHTWIMSWKEAEVLKEPIFLAKILLHKQQNLAKGTACIYKVYKKSKGPVDYTFKMATTDKKN